LETKIQNESYRFGPFRLSESERVLRRDNQIVSLSPKCFETLLVLVRKGGTVVEKDALMRAVWPDSFVEENNLAQNIFVLRRALGELPEGGPYIQTVPKRGYRLAVEPEFTGSEPAKTTSPPPAPRRAEFRISHLLAAGMLLVSTLVAARWLWPPGTRPLPQPHFATLAVPNNVIYGSISPDGQRFAYVSGDEDGQSLWLRDTAAVGPGARIVQPARGHYWGIGFAPSGDSLYYVFEDDRQPAKGTLFRIERGGEPRALFSDIATVPSFSPDGRMAFKRYEAGHGYLFTAADDGGSPRQLARSEAAHPFFSFQWSADGKSVEYVEGTRSDKGSAWSIWEMPAAGGAPRRLLSPQPAPLLHAVWLSRDEILALIPESGSGKGQIWHVTTGGRLQRVTNDINDYSQISPTADGRTLLATIQETDDSIWTASATEGGHGPATRMLLPHGTYDDPALTPDGRVVFAADSNLWISSADGADRKPLLTQKATVFEPAVSPTGKFVVFSMARGAERNLWRVGTDGGDLRQITTAPYDWHPAISPDGKWLAYESRVAGEHTLWKTPLDGGGAPVKLRATGGSDLAISPDGAWIAFRADTGELTVCSLRDGSPLRSFPVPADPSFLRWTRDGKSILYASPAGRSTRFWRQALDGGTPVSLDESLPTDMRHAKWSPDGRHMTYLRRELRVQLTLLTNFLP
jgi:Tol biopolymer transport system component/DNA-binding winged helix-turn-helix (wHTH) protein